MVKVVTVAWDFEPPLEEKYALVEVAHSGARYFGGAVKDESVGLFRTNNDAPDIANAIDDACEWARKNGASVVYVARPDGAAL
jgi:hypothetical protein